MSDWTRPRRGRRTALLVTAGVVVAAGCFGIGRWTAPSNGSPGTAGPAGPTTQAAPAPPGTAATVGGGDVVLQPYTGATPAGTAGWDVPRPQAGHGPVRVTAAGVPSGYTKDRQGAGLAAANAVVGGLWLSSSVFKDPWQALGALAADTSKLPPSSGLALRAQGRWQMVQWLLGRHVLGGVAAPSIGASGSVSFPTATAPPAVKAAPWGSKVLGVKTTLGVSDGVPTADAVVLWETVGTTPYGSDGVSIAQVTMVLVWQSGDWKVAEYDQGSEVGKHIGDAAGLALPRENWIA